MLFHGNGGASLARKTSKMTDKKIERYIKEGRGQGEGAEYTPWLKVGDFSSKGRGHRIKDPKTGREHHFFSDLEADYFWYLIWNDNIVDIREQYPLLPVEEAEEIALHLEYKYPYEPGENTRHVMTTDFLITVKNSDGEYIVARHVKYAKDLNNPRTLEKFEIECAYWASRGVELRAVTEESFDRRMARNIAFLMGYYSSLPQLDDPRLYTQIVGHIHELLLPAWQYHSLSSLMRRVDKEFDLPGGTALSVFFHLAASKEIPLQMNHELHGSMNLGDIIDWPKLNNTKKEVDLYANYA